MKLNPFAWPLAAKVAAVVLVVGGAAGAATIASFGEGSGGAQSTANPGSSNCLLGANGADVEVGIAHPANSCARWIQNLAGSGLVWYPIAQMAPPGSAGTADSETMASACDLTSGEQELYVEDAAGQSYGDSICSQEEQNGWTPEGSPGPLALIAQQQVQAQASASAAASQASADEAAQQQAANDLQALQGFSLSSDLGKLSGDLTHTMKNLAAEKSAAAAGPNADGGDCYNLTSNVDYDAESNVEYDAQSDFGYDLQTDLEPDIASGRNGIHILKSDLSNLESVGLPTPSGAQSTIAAAKSEINNAVSAANADIGTENGYVDDAYAVANGIATGSCAGDGTGPAPQPIQEIG